MAQHLASSTIDRLRSGIAADDKQAFALMYSKFGGAILGFILKTISSRKEAEEVLQLAMLKIWEQRASFSDMDDRLALVRMVMITRQVIGNAISNAGGVIARMPEGDMQQKAFELVYCQGYDIAAAAEKLNINAEQVKTMLRIAMNNLKSRRHG